MNYNGFDSIPVSIMISAKRTCLPNTINSTSLDYRSLIFLDLSESNGRKTPVGRESSPECRLHPGSERWLRIEKNWRLAGRFPQNTLSSCWFTEGYLSMYWFDKAIVSHRKPTVGAESDLEPQPLHIVLGKLNQLLASFEVLGPSWGRRMHGDISNNENSTPPTKMPKSFKTPDVFWEKQCQTSMLEKKGGYLSFGGCTTLVSFKRIIHSSLLMNSV